MCLIIRYNFSVVNTGRSYLRLGLARIEWGLLTGVWVAIVGSCLLKFRIGLQ